MISLQFVKAPDVGSGPTKVRIVHLSDTHMQHRRFDKNSIVGMDAFVFKEKTTVSNIKSAGDILIHTGDFTKRLKASADYDTVLKDFNNFLGELPHTHKIVIAGNSEIVFNSLTHEQIQNYLSNCTYLQDSSATIMGIKFYGSPWTTSRNMGFSCPSDEIKKHWKKIPKKIDILLTHLPPHNIMDLAYSSRTPDPNVCSFCNNAHPGFRHWGCKYLHKTVVKKIKPKCHLFGHVHEGSGFTVENNVLFCNSATDLTNQAVYFDYYI